MAIVSAAQPDPSVRTAAAAIASAMRGTRRCQRRRLVPATAGDTAAGTFPGTGMNVPEDCFVLLRGALVIAHAHSLPLTISVPAAVRA